MLEDFHLSSNRLTGGIQLFYNNGHNILKLFDSKPNFLFITSEAKRDY